MDFASALIGAAGVAGAILAYFAATKGVPATWSWVKSKWNAGAAELVTLKGDVASAHTKIAALEAHVTAIAGPVAALQTDVGALKAKVGA